MLVRAPLGELRLAQLGHVGAGHHHAAPVGTVDARDEVEQRGLARARRSHERLELPLGTSRVMSCEHRDAGCRAGRTWTHCGSERLESVTGEFLAFAR